VQPPLGQGDGPIALIMAPTRELVVQIGKDVKRFARQLGLTCVCAYGGAALGSQISELKRGAEACAPPGSGPGAAAAHAHLSCSCTE